MNEGEMALDWSQKRFYWHGMTSRIGSKGQVVIPEALRERTGPHPGAEVEFDLRGDELVVVPHARRRPLGGRFGRDGMAAKLLDDRASEPR
jgi:AbrB family looped-hinge helix DNA binding protein